MRLKPEKIEQLSEHIHDCLARIPELKLGGEKKDIVFEISKVITEDIKIEEEIEAEARKVLESHEDDIRRSGVRYDVALQKTKLMLARNRKFVI